jgi:hypothetical protein
VDTLKGPPVEREERDEALRAQGEQNGLVVAAVLEASEQIDPDARFGRARVHQLAVEGPGRARAAAAVAE